MTRVIIKINIDQIVEIEGHHSEVEVSMDRIIRENHNMSSSFSLEQNCGCSCRQAFIHYCGLHQVYGKTKKNLPYMGFNRFYEHAQNLLGGVKKEVDNN